MRFRRFSPFLPGLAMLLATAVADTQNAPALAGRWEGTLIPRTPRGSRDLSQRANAPRLPTVVIITTADGTHGGTWATGVLGIRPAPANAPWTDEVAKIGAITNDGDTVRITVPDWNGSWEGKLSTDGATLEGSWRQGGSTSPLVLKKVAAQ